MLSPALGVPGVGTLTHSASVSVPGRGQCSQTLKALTWYGDLGSPGAVARVGLELAGLRALAPTGTVVTGRPVRLARDCGDGAGRQRDAAARCRVSASSWAWTGRPGSPVSPRGRAGPCSQRREPAGCRGRAGSGIACRRRPVRQRRSGRSTARWPRWSRQCASAPVVGPRRLASEPGGACRATPAAGACGRQPDGRRTTTGPAAPPGRMRRPCRRTTRVTPRRRRCAPGRCLHARRVRCGRRPRPPPRSRRAW